MLAIATIPAALVQHLKHIYKLLRCAKSLPRTVLRLILRMWMSLFWSPLKGSPRPPSTRTQHSTSNTLNNPKDQDPKYENTKSPTLLLGSVPSESLNVSSSSQPSFGSSVNTMPVPSVASPGSSVPTFPRPPHDGTCEDQPISMPTAGEAEGLGYILDTGTPGYAGGMPLDSLAVHDQPVEPRHESEPSTTLHEVSLEDPYNFLLYMHPTDPNTISDERYRYRQKIRYEDTSWSISCVPRYSILPQRSPIYGWESLVHPEGARYWYHPSWKVYAPAYPGNETVLNIATQFARNLREEMKISSEALLDVVVDGQGVSYTCRYYLVDHENRTIYWVHNHDASALLADVKGVTSASHAKYGFEIQYWTHCELFPHGRNVTPELRKELTGILVYAGYGLIVYISLSVHLAHERLDALFSETSTCPFPNKGIQDMLSYVEQLAEIGDIGGYAFCVVARMMVVMVRERFINFAGEHCARLSSDQAVYGLDDRRSLLMRIVSCLLFFAPDVYLSSLRGIWIDQKINGAQWQSFLARQWRDWQELVLNATVLLTVNTALLAIPSVDSGDGYSYRSPTQILSYISALASVGVIIIGLVLMKPYRRSPRESIVFAAGRFKCYEDRGWGLEVLAIMHSLPYAGLMWAIFTLLAAFASLLFLNTETVTRATTGAVLLVILAFTLWSVVDTWHGEGTPDIGTEWPRVNLGRLLSRSRKGGNVPSSPSQAALNPQPEAQGYTRHNAPV